MNIKKWPFKLKRILFLKWLQPKVKVNTIRIGGAYGGWIIPENYLTPESICYLAGAGEDVTFDIGIHLRYKCHVHIFDPTPRAFQHFKALENSCSSGIAVTTGNGESYCLENLTFDKIKFHSKGLWDKEETIRFYAPKNKDHVSYSALNLQKTDEYFEAEVLPLSQFMKQLKHEKIDLLKLDIEGAEYKVLQSIIDDALGIPVICVEFDESHTPLDGNFHKRINETVKLLRNHGYLVAAIDNAYNFTFITRQLYSKLNAATTSSSEN
jgi:FkbM family methyltransferase